MAVHLIELSKIRIDAGTQSRAEISEHTVTEYHEVLEEGIDFPPIKVFYDGVAYYVGDGFHRYLAHKRSKRDMIECEVESGTIRDAVLYSLSANSKHGLRRTNADKRKAVLTVLADPEWSEFSSRKIADMCAVSHMFVNNIRKEVEREAEKSRVNISKTKPPKLNNVVEEPLEEDEVGSVKDDMVAELIEQNERLNDRLAVEVMDASEEEKTLAKETIDSLRSEVKNLRIELEAVKKSRDQYQMECSEMKKQIKMLQRQLNK